MTLHELGLKHGTDKATAHHYLEFYEAQLPKKITRLLEIGVKDGASLRMWHEYYPDAEIVGIDIEAVAPVDGCTVIRMDATDVSALHTLGSFDVIVDDGSHKTKDQLISFAQLYHHQLNDGGVYVMEDIHTSYYSEYANTLRNTRSYLRGIYPKRITEWQRVPGDFTDSCTMIIRKP